MRKKKAAVDRLVAVLHVSNERHVLYASPDGVVSLPVQALASAQAYLREHDRYERAPRRVCGECQFETVTLPEASESHARGCSRAPQKK